MEREFFEISGYWKDDNELFEGYMVTNYDDVPGKDDPYTEDDIFYFGLGSVDLEQMVKDGRDTVEDFVVTNFEKIQL